MLKHSAIGLLAISIAACSSAPKQSLSYGNPPSLLTLTPDQQLSVYKNIEAAYAVRTAKRGTKIQPLPLTTRQIAPTITWNEKTYADVDSFMAAARMTGILVIKDGKIAMERYGFGRKPEDRWTSFSVGKSVTSILLGAAIQDGYIKSLDEPVTKYVPQLKGSGYDGVNIDNLSL